MPVYNIEVPPQTRNAWAEGLGSLADAFAPNPAVEIERAKAGMAREELNFNMGMKEREFGLAARETDASIARLNAAAAAAYEQGEYYDAETLRSAAEKLKVEAETGLLTQKHDYIDDFVTGAEALGTTEPLEEDFDPTTAPGNVPSWSRVWAAGQAGGIDTDLGEIAAVGGMPQGERFDQLLTAGGTAYPQTQMGAREAEDAALERKYAEPVIIPENSYAILPPSHPSYNAATGGGVGGQSSVAHDEQIIRPPLTPGGPERPVIGPNFTADAPTPPDYSVYTWADESGVQHQTMARVLPDSRIVDRDGNELPMTAIETPVSVNATSLSGASLGVKTEADKKVFSLLRRMINSDKYLQTDPVPGVMQFMMAIPGDSMWSTLSRRLLSNDPAESFMASAQQFLTAVLRLDSGAAVPITEYPSYYAQFIPLPGDGAETIRRKAEARRVAMEALRDPLMGEASAEDLMIRVSEEVGEPPPLPAAVAAAAGLPRGRVVEDPAAAAGAPATAAPAQRKYEWTFNPGAS